MNILEIEKRILEKISSWELDDFYVYSNIKLFREEVYNLIGNLPLDELENDLITLYKEVNLSRIDKTDTDLHSDEYITNQEKLNAIQFLCKTLLQKEIKIQQDNKHLTYYDSNEIGFKRISFKKYLSLLSSNSSKTSIPENWRPILLDIFLSCLPNISGRFIKNSYSELEKHTFFEREEFDLKSIDLSIMMALKIALKHNESLTTSSNKIILGLSGGVISSIEIRKKGEWISKFQVKPVEIFLITDYWKDKSFRNNSSFSNEINEWYELRTLYYQTGYADSKLSIEMPKGYYIITDHYVIEIYFDSAPVLLDTNKSLMGVSNIAIKAKIEDEEEEQRLEEEG